MEGLELVCDGEVGERRYLASVIGYPGTVQVCLGTRLVVPLLYTYLCYLALCPSVAGTGESRCYW